MWAERKHHKCYSAPPPIFILYQLVEELLWFHVQPSTIDWCAPRDAHSFTKDVLIFMAGLLLATWMSTRA